MLLCRSPLFRCIASTLVMAPQFPLAKTSFCKTSPRGSRRIRASWPTSAGTTERSSSNRSTPLFPNMRLARTAIPIRNGREQILAAFRARFQQAILANFCIWLIEPSSVGFTNGFHALTNLGSQVLDRPVVNHIDPQGPIYCHPKDSHNKVTGKHLIGAAALFEALSTVPRNNSLWEALRASCDALYL